MISSVISGVKLPPTYPLLMNLAEDPDFVVLFTDCNQGVVVAAGPDSLYDIGYFGEAWDEEVFDLFDGQVSLSNHGASQQSGASTESDEAGSDHDAGAPDFPALFEALAVTVLGDIRNGKTSGSFRV